jgi:hypothetical protein
MQRNDDVVFIRLAQTPSSVSTLYRGFSDEPSIMFSLPVILGGLFARSLPESVSIENVRTHKTTNCSNDNYLFSMTESEEVAKTRGKGNFLTIDPVLFREFIIDIHQSYKWHSLTFPARMQNEAEHASLVMLYCSVKSITINHIESINPFYIAIHPENEEAISRFKPIYKTYLSLLRAKINDTLSKNEEEKALMQFCENYLDFYRDYAKEKNPFDMTVEELKAEHPVFNELERLNNSYDPGFFRSSLTLKDLVIAQASQLFNHHAYMIEMLKPKNSFTNLVKPCNEDVWSRPVYE